MSDLPSWLTTLVSAVGGALAKAFADAVRDKLSATGRLKKAEREIGPSKPPPPPASALPVDVVLLAREVELVRMRDELREAQSALVRLRSDLDRARHVALHAEAADKELRETQAHLRRLRSSLDQATLENARLAGELAAERGYAQTLCAEMRALRLEGGRPSVIERPPEVEARYRVERVERKK